MSIAFNGSVPVADLVPYVNNARTHSDEQVAQVAASIREFGFTNPILVDEQNTIIAGHGRLAAAHKLGMDTVPTIQLEGLSEAQKKAYVIADNSLALNAGWDEAMLRLEIDELVALDFDTDLLGFDSDMLSEIMGDDDGIIEKATSEKMSENFGFPPFTVLNAREGRWQGRKRSWIAKGIDSSNGRPENLINHSKITSIPQGKDTSIFDPVLCEMAYRWFSPPGGLILDPFAGGSVRGIVASLCGREYIGNDLRPEQIAANRSQAEQVCEIQPVWTVGDSLNIKHLVGDIQADGMLSCPPYANLEVYSDNPLDISTMNYQEFIGAYRHIIAECFDLLKDNTFSVWVVGEVRDKKGNYYNFVGDTIAAFIAAGFKYYNEAILVTSVGSLSLRAGRHMKASRKMGKTHQNVLVFVKGDGKAAAKLCGDIEVHIDDEDLE